MSVYSSLKFLHHADRLKVLRSGEQIAPVHAHLIISDLCSQNCSFCLVSGTKIDTPAGGKAIEDIRIGDQVQDANGGVSVVTETSGRISRTVYEICAGEKRIVCSAEHPVLCDDGFKEAQHIAVGDRVVVRDWVTAEEKSLGCEPGLFFCESVLGGEPVRRAYVLRDDFPVQLYRRTATRLVSSVTRIDDGDFAVYNFSCSPAESYFANGIAVHNCSYRMDGNVSNRLFHVLNNDGTKNHNPARFIPYEKITEIIDDFREMGVKAVQFTGGGEPTLHPRHHDAFKYALDSGLDVALVTHGVLLKPEVIETLTRATWVRVSLDCATPETYAEVRRVSQTQFKRACENIAALCKARDDSGSKLVVGVGFVVTKENWREVVQAAKLAKSLGADNLRISAVFQPDGANYFADFYAEASALCKEAERESGDGFLVVNMFGARLADLHLGNPDYKACGFMQFTTYVGGDLNVYRCCTTAYNEQGLIGSLKNQRFRELWESQAKRDDFAAFDARGCERCMFNDQNRAIEYATRAEPAHVNFV